MDGRDTPNTVRVERAPGGWAVVHRQSRRRWTFAREEAALRLASAVDAAKTTTQAALALRRLDREAGRASQRDLVARAAAGELLDQAALHCFVAPVEATDVVRWNHLRRQPERVRYLLQENPAAFGPMRVEREAPALWADLPEPRHAHVPAWARFREAAGVWLDVLEGARWSPPADFPPPPPPPVPAAAALTHEPATRPDSGPTPSPPAMPAQVHPSHPEDSFPFGRSRRRGLSL